jgi:hypothetical protein
MGLSETINTVPFTENDCKNKKLVIKMLKFEDEYSKTTNAQEMYRSFDGSNLNPIYSMHRYVLNKFGFDTTDESIKNYRKIFKTYFNSHLDYDHDVINSVHYMRSNKCVFYSKPILNIGQNMIDVSLLTLNNKPINLFDILKETKFTYGFVAAFSTS